MIAAANVQTYFCLLLAPWIAEGALQGGSDMHVVSIVAFEVEERTAQDFARDQYQVSVPLAR